MHTNVRDLQGIKEYQIGSHTTIGKYQIIIFTADGGFGGSTGAPAAVAAPTAPATPTAPSTLTAPATPTAPAVF